MSPTKVVTSDEETPTISAKQKKLATALAKKDSEKLTSLGFFNRTRSQQWFDPFAQSNDLTSQPENLTKNTPNKNK